jgi:hypothetical protein
MSLVTFIVLFVIGVLAVSYSLFVLKEMAKHERDVLQFMAETTTWTIGLSWQDVADQVCAITQAEFDKYLPSQQVLVNKILAYHSMPIFYVTVTPVITPLIVKQPKSTNKVAGLTGKLDTLAPVITPLVNPVAAAKKPKIKRVVKEAPAK